MSNYLLGIDVGTTTVKVGLFEAEKGLVAIRRETYPLSAPAYGCCEQSADDIWGAIVRNVKAVLAAEEGPSADEVRAVSLSLQGGTLICTDKDFKPLRPAIVWSDTRCVKQAKDFTALFGQDYLYKTTGWPTENGLMALQIEWLREKEPATYLDAAYFLSVPDFVSAKLCGVPALDLADAGINQLADIRRGVYDEKILAYLGIDESKLGKIVPSGTVIGNLTEEAAAELGLTTETKLISGAHDQYAVACGIGCLHSGDIMIGSGTAWAVTALGEDWDFESGFAQSKAAVGELKGSLADLSNGGGCLEWLRGSVAIGPGGEKYSFKELDEGAAAKEVGSGHLFFYPYFSGIPYPLNDPSGKGAFIGLDLSHDRFAMARSVMEGVAFQILWMLEGFAERFPMQSIKFSGGAAGSALWTQIMADASGLPVSVPQNPELACVGAAMLAGVGSGLYPDYDAAFAALTVPERTVYPNPENAGKYVGLLAEYKQKARGLAALYELKVKECTIWNK